MAKERKLGLSSTKKEFSLINEQCKRKLIRELRTAFRSICSTSDLKNDAEVKEAISELIIKVAPDYCLGLYEKKEIIESIFNEARRFGILQPLLDDPEITEIMINGPEDIYIEKGGYVTKQDLLFDNSKELEDLIQNIVAKASRMVNEASPIVDAHLPDGSRVNIVLPPVALNGSVMTIRKFTNEGMSIEALINASSLTAEAGEFLKAVVEARYNIFICGGTGSGKTTFLNALSAFIPQEERVITIEDSAELKLKGLCNHIRLETRNANSEGKGRITIKDLIRTSLRMRPERIIVGEVRGEEAADMLQAMNTGHEGSLSTGHANSARDMLSRLETMVLTGMPLPLEAIRQQIASAIDIIIYLSRMRDKSRRVLEIAEISGFSDGNIILNPLFLFKEQYIGKQDSESLFSPITGVLEKTGNHMKRIDKFRISGVKCPFKEG